MTRNVYHLFVGVRRVSIIKRISNNTRIKERGIFQRVEG